MTEWAPSVEGREKRDVGSVVGRRQGEEVKTCGNAMIVYSLSEAGRASEVTGTRKTVN